MNLHVSITRNARTNQLAILSFDYNYPLQLHYCLTPHAVNTPRKAVFGTPLAEHLRCTGRSVSLVIELCTHLLYLNGLSEEGLFRVPGSSMKIKKLKNSINAWFIALANKSELDQDNTRPAATGDCRTNASTLAIYKLFKETVSLQQPPQPSAGKHIVSGATTPVGSNAQTPSSDDISISSSSTKSDQQITIDTNAARQSCAPTSNQDGSKQHLHRQQDVCEPLLFDVHTVAGLLKLYLRELPEPLFTYEHYDKWVSATTSNTDSNDTEAETGPQIEALRSVIEQLPKENRDNLSHLIRFLHLVARHSNSNKMTASNLAITMAPSLIWAPTDVPKNANTHSDDATQAFNMRMSSIGMSASLHAHILECLIEHADVLMPGSTNFSIPHLDDLTNVNLKYSSTDALVEGRKSSAQSRERTISSSPTGISTDSASSFSSGSTGSDSDPSQSAGDQKALGDQSAERSSSATEKPVPCRSSSPGHLAPLRSNSRAHEARLARPMSVFVAGTSSMSSVRGAPPPVPPAPLTRSILRQSTGNAPLSMRSDSQTSPLPQRSMRLRPCQKPPPPPIPHNDSNNEHNIIKNDNQENDGTQKSDATGPIAMPRTTTTTNQPTGTSLRGTGTTTDAHDQMPSPPVRPPRSTSPKMTTQSTLL